MNNLKKLGIGSGIFLVTLIIISSFNNPSSTIDESQEDFTGQDMLKMVKETNSIEPKPELKPISISELEPITGLEPVNPKLDPVLESKYLEALLSLNERFGKSTDQCLEVDTFGEYLEFVQAYNKSVDTILEYAELSGKLLNKMKDGGYYSNQELSIQATTLGVLTNMFGTCLENIDEKYG